MHKLDPLSIAILISTLLTGVASAQQYKIKLSRDEKAGDQYTAKITGSIKHTVQLTVSGQVRPKSSDKMLFDLHGVMKIAAVNPKTATATSIKFTLTRFTRNGDDVYPAGTVIAAELKEGKTIFTLDGKPADDANLDLLNIVLGLDDPENVPTADDIAGTTEPRAVGDSWPISTDNFSKAMTAGGLPIGTGKVKGESKLASVKKIDGTVVMEVDTTATAEGFKKEVKKGAQLTDGSLKVEGSVVVPVDASLPIVSTTTRSHLSTTITEGTLKREIVEDREVEEEHAPVRQ